MKVLFTAVLTCVISQMLWISLSSGQGVCSDHNNTETDCCSAQMCNFITCINSTGANQTFCVLKNETSEEKCIEGELKDTHECKDPTTPNPTTPNTTTTNPPPITQAPEPTQAPTTGSPSINCSVNEDKSACCATGGQCFFYGCSKANEKNTYCVNNATTPTCPEGYVNSTDTCEQETTTPASNSSTTPDNVTQAPSIGDLVTQHFDGASFVGGIVLAVCLTGIAIIGYKFYKSRTEKNYQNL